MKKRWRKLKHYGEKEQKYIEMKMNCACIGP